MRRCGYTLLEVVIGTGVAGLLLIALYQLFVAGLHLYMRGDTRAEMQAAGLAAGSDLVREIHLASAGLLTIRPADPAAISFFLLDSNNPGSPGFFVLYYLDSGAHTLVRKTYHRDPPDPVALSPNPIDENRRLLADEIKQICAVPNGSERIFAGNVQALTFFPPQFPDAAAVNPHFSVTLALQKDLLGQSFLETVTVTAQPRN